MRSLKARAEASVYRANTMGAGACEPLDKMFELRAIVEVVNCTVGAERACAAGLDESDMI